MDRTVVPSYLRPSIGVPNTISNFTLNYSENSLRTGVVEEIFPPTHPQNRSKRYSEYNVGVIYNRGTGPASYTRYFNCIQMDTFGSFADHFNATLRKSTQSPKDVSLTKGARVLVLCVNDDTTQGVIIGNLPNSNVPVVQEDLGHHLSFEFNGVQVEINKDGELSLTRKGPTDEAGNVLSGFEDGAGATIKMAASGNIEMSSGQNVVSVALDGENGSLNLTCTEGVVINSGSQSMVQGENLAASITTLMNTIATNVAAIAPNGAAIAGVINGAMANFRSSDFLSTKNKVD